MLIDAATLTQVSDAELALAEEAINAERTRRVTLANIDNLMADLARDYFDAAGIAQGDPWQAPSGGYRSYPLDWQVTHNGATWASQVAGNTTEPGVAGWTEQTEPPTEDEGGQ